MPKLVSQQSKQLFRHLLIKPLTSCTVKKQPNRRRRSLTDLKKSHTASWLRLRVSHKRLASPEKVNLSGKVEDKITTTSLWKERRIGAGWRQNLSSQSETREWVIVSYLRKTLSQSKQLSSVLNNKAYRMPTEGTTGSCALSA